MIAGHLLLGLVCISAMPSFTDSVLYTVYVGEAVTLACATTHQNSVVEWQFRAKGQPLYYLYVNKDITASFKHGGRHSFESNDDTGSYDLTITNITSSDSGNYTCIEEVGTERTIIKSFELSVLRESFFL
jgi:hypothetical protein